MDSIVLATANRGDHASRKDLTNFLEGVDIASLNEMHSEKATRLWFRESKEWGIFEGLIEDSEADCVVWRHNSIRVTRRSSLLLLAADTRDGKHNMKKSLDIVKFEVRGADHGGLFSGIHQIQTVGTHDRRIAAKVYVHRVNRAYSQPARHDQASFCGGDWNAIWPHDVMTELHHGWNCDVELKPGLNTLGNRNIDYFVYRNLRAHKMVIDNVWTDNINGSDHDGKKIRVKLL